MGIRIATWNLWWRFGPWEQRGVAIQRVLADADADVVCLQEVWAQEGGPDQVELLASSLGMSYCRTPSPFWQGYSFGNAILSRHPILGVEYHALPGRTGSSGNRSLIIASIGFDGAVIPVACTHLDYLFDQSELRRRQAERVLEHCVAAYRDPVGSFPLVLCGDLNAVPDSEEIRALTGRSAPLIEGHLFNDAWELCGDGPGHTWSSRNPYLSDATWPNRRLDYIMVSWPRPKGLGKPLTVELIGTTPVDGVMASDHFGVVATLRTDSVG